MKKKRQIRIILADDHAVLREGLKTLLGSEDDMVVVGEAADGSSVLPLVEKLSPDVVLMDISMGRGSGAAATREIKKQNKDVSVLVLTVHEDASYLQEMLTAGASGYILKRAATKELIKAIRIIADGRTYLDPEMSAAVVQSFSPLKADGQKFLTARELSVAKLLAQGYTQKEIAAQLSVSIKTVDTHKARCMEKLGLSSRAELVRFAYQQGWFQELQPPTK